ncbi:MAG: hypothetical protein GX963_07830 [Bacteroidales bacterium]|nr:hypothetical protein [Bacteroidales bacterium]
MKISSEFKSKIGLASLREDCTAQELCEKYSLHSNQVYEWSNHILKSAGSLLEKESKSKGKANNFSDEQASELNKLIGEITVENNFLKKVEIMSREERSRINDFS